MALLLFLLLVTPVIENAHADHCEAQACYVCTTGSGGTAAVTNSTTPTFPVARGEHRAYDAGRRSPDALTDLRSRGPPERP